jgi:hypothetical protein
VDKQRGFCETRKLPVISTEIAEREAMFTDYLLKVSKIESGSNSGISEGALHLGNTEDFAPFYFW